MVDGTLFKGHYRTHQDAYQIVSYTPVDDYPKPLSLNCIIFRHEAEDYRERNFVAGHSIDSAAMQLGIDKLAPQIPHALRKLREKELVQGELEVLEGFGSF
mgnify:CR=1 FL=1